MFNLFVLIFIFQTGIALSNRVTDGMDALAVVPDVIDVAPAAQIQVIVPTPSMIHISMINASI